ncbi:MAG: hypothetical protein ACR2O4_05085, partial [Hyphomicrobiaceae bacterium]
HFWTLVHTSVTDLGDDGGVLHPQIVILAAARIHVGIGREGLGGTTGLVDMCPLQPSRSITPHGQVDSHVDTRMREHDRAK